MPTSSRLESALHDAVGRLTAQGCPPQLADGIRYAVFPPGNRLRPHLALATCEALGVRESELAESAAVALEFLHCASLVQDDMPAFDHSPQRRGRPSLHRAYGDATAILVADALIIGAFDTVAHGAAADVTKAAAMTIELARGSGSPHGAVAGQAWESEEGIDLVQYHRAKTAALFESATAVGAIVAGQDPSPWRRVGHWLGRAYQVADDVADDAGTGDGNSDADLGRPNALRALGREASLHMLEQCIHRALAAIPDCPGKPGFRAFLVNLLERFRPEAMADRENRTRHETATPPRAEATS